MRIRYLHNVFLLQFYDILFRSLTIDKLKKIHNLRDIINFHLVRPSSHTTHIAVA